MKSALAKSEIYEHPLFKNVLAQNSTFEREATDFYDLSSWLEEHYINMPFVTHSIEEFIKFKLEEENPQKRGKYPTDLVEILSHFSEKPFDTSKLQYESVREDHERWHDTSRSRKIMGINLGVSFVGFTVGAIGLSACILTALIGNPEIAIPSGVIGAGGTGAGIWALNYDPKPNGTNYEWKEYIKLHKSAVRADEDINEHRNYYLKKAS